MNRGIVIGMGITVAAILLIIGVKGMQKEAALSMDTRVTSLETQVASLGNQVEDLNRKLQMAINNQNENNQSFDKAIKVIVTSIQRNHPKDADKGGIFGLFKSKAKTPPAVQTGPVQK